MAQNTAWMPINSILSITVYLFLAVVWNRYTDRYEVGYIVYIFVIPLIFNWIPLINETYGRAGAWCWIKSLDIDTCEIIKFGRDLQLILYYAPLFLFLLTQLLLYLIILCQLYRNKRRWKGTIANKTEDDATNKLSPCLPSHLHPNEHPPSGHPHPRVDPPQGEFAAAVVPHCHLLPGIIIVLAFTFDADTRRRLKWTHLRAAITNYKKIIPEYKVGDGTSEASYKRYTDNTDIQTPELH